MKQFSEYTCLLFVDLIADTYNIREVQFICNEVDAFCP